jgi:hypothetical protein
MKGEARYVDIKDVPYQFLDQADRAKYFPDGDECSNYKSTPYDPINRNFMTRRKKKLAFHDIL